MKTIAIPTILAAIVVTAGMFAFMPVQEASTVHEAVLDTTMTASATEDTTSFAAVNTSTQSQTYTFTSDEAYELWGITVTGDMSAFSTAGDILQIQDIQIGPNDLSFDDLCAIGGGSIMPLQVAVGTDTASQTADVFLANIADNLDSCGSLPLVAGTEIDVILDIIEAGGNDGGTSPTITVSITTFSRGDAIEQFTAP